MKKRRLDTTQLRVTTLVYGRRSWTSPGLNILIYLMFTTVIMVFLVVNKHLKYTNMKTYITYTWVLLTSGYILLEILTQTGFTDTSVQVFNNREITCGPLI